LRCSRHGVRVAELAHVQSAAGQANYVGLLKFRTGWALRSLIILLVALLALPWLEVEGLAAAGVTASESAPELPLNAQKSPVRERSEWVHQPDMMCAPRVRGLRRDSANSRNVSNVSLGEHWPCRLWSLPDCKVKCLNVNGCWGIAVDSNGGMSFVRSSCLGPGGLDSHPDRRIQPKGGHHLHILRLVDVDVARQPLRPPLSMGRAFPPIFPVPMQFHNGTQPVLVNAAALQCSIEPKSAVGADDPVLREAFARLRATALHVEGRHNRKWPTQRRSRLMPGHRIVGVISTIVIRIRSPDVTLQLDTSETYELMVNATGMVRIDAGTVYGAVRALDSLAQLVVFEASSKQHLIHHCPWRIVDRPRFQHRGLLLDTGRHFLPPQTLRNVIDSMVYVKLNTLHWHVYDFESFPLESAALPRLWEASFSRDERYTRADVRALVEYARRRAVRVVVEMDVPGHARCAPPCNLAPRTRAVHLARAPHSRCVTGTCTWDSPLWIQFVVCRVPRPLPNACVRSATQHSE